MTLEVTSRGLLKPALPRAALRCGITRSGSTAAAAGSVRGRGGLWPRREFTRHSGLCLLKSVLKGQLRAAFGLISESP